MQVNITHMTPLNKPNLNKVELGPGGDDDDGDDDEGFSLVDVR